VDRCEVIESGLGFIKGEGEITIKNSTLKKVEMHGLKARSVHIYENKETDISLGGKSEKVIFDSNSKTSLIMGIETPVFTARGNSMKPEGIFSVGDAPIGAAKIENCNNPLKSRLSLSQASITKVEVSNCSFGELAIHDANIGDATFTNGRIGEIIYTDATIDNLTFKNILLSKGLKEFTNTKIGKFYHKGLTVADEFYITGDGELARLLKDKRGKKN